jgi:P4 family phage/plasmid primase-like protien
VHDNALATPLDPQLNPAVAQPTDLLTIPVGLYDLSAIRRSLEITTVVGHVYELRTTGKVYSGYYNDFDEMAKDAARLSHTPGVTGVFITINPVLPELLARTNNTVALAQRGISTSDKEVLRRTTFVIDIDSVVRAAGISATEAEKEVTFSKAQEVRAYLDSIGFPVPLFADSGNGNHLRFDIDLPNDAPSKKLLENALKGLALKFNDAATKVDTTLFNASRICKIYGTRSAKGADMPDRPWRITRIIEEGSGIVVTREQLEKLAALLPTKQTSIKKSLLVQSTSTDANAHDWTPEEVEAMMAAFGLMHKGRAEYGDGFKWQLDACIFDSSHQGTDAVLYLFRNDTGTFYFTYKCSHDSCQQFKGRTQFITELKKQNPEVEVDFHDKPSSLHVGTATIESHDDPDDMFVAKYGYTDSGNGNLFVKHNKDRVRFCPSLNHAGWFVWNGQRWEQDPLKQVTEYARTVMNDMLMSATAKFTTLAANNPARQTAEAAMKWARASLSHRRIQDMLAQAGAGTDLCVAGDIFDARPELLNLQNGTLNLDTSDFYPARKEDLLTQISNVSYTLGAICPRWQKFLNEVTEGDIETQNYLQRVFGYMLTGDQREQCFFVFYGRGGTGKGVFWRTLQGMLGDYFSTASMGLFVNSGSQQAVGEAASPAKAALAGKRVVVTSELDEGVRFNEALLKLVTGGDSLTARKLHQPPFTFQPQCKPVFMTNYLPRTSDFSGGLEQRLRIVKFNRQFRDTADEVKDLHKTFVAEYDGILQWALAGLKEVREHGLQEPASVKENVKAYMRNENAVSRWLDERTVPCPDELLAVEAYKDFHLWSDFGNEACKKRSNKWFYSQLEDLGIDSRHSMGGTMVKGFRLRSSVPSVTVTVGKQ